MVFPSEIDKKFDQLSLVPEIRASKYLQFQNKALRRSLAQPPKQLAGGGPYVGVVGGAAGVMCGLANVFAVVGL